VEDRTPAQLQADGDTHWPDGKPYNPPVPDISDRVRMDAKEDR
jgi:hypothetical protein